MTDDTAKNKRRSRGDGGLYLDANGYWVGIVWVLDPITGKRKQKRVASKIKSKALEKLNTLRSDLKTGKVATNSGRAGTVGDWLDEWLETIVKPNVRPKTYKSYEGTARLYLKPHIGHIRLDKLTAAQVRAMHKKLREGYRGTAGSTRNSQKAHQVLNAALGRALKDEMIPRNVCDAVDNPKHTKKRRGAFELSTAVHVLKTAATRDDADNPSRPKVASRWVAAFMTGARQAELIGLEWDRVDLDAGVMDISWQLQRMQYVHGCGEPKGDKYPCGRNHRPGYCPDKRWDFDPAFEYRDCHRSLVWTRPKSQAGERNVPMAPLLLEALKVHKRLDTDPNPHNLVWHHRDGRPLSQEDDNEQWNMLIAAAGIEKASREVVLHEARNTAATMLLESGIDAKVIQDIMGHASILQTRDYQRVSLELSKSAVASAFDALLPG